MTDLVEKVARAIWDARSPPYPFENASGDEVIDTRLEARAALRVVREALAEPDEAMAFAPVSSVHEVINFPDGSQVWQGISANKSRAVWRAMLVASPIGRTE